MNRQTDTADKYQSRSENLTTNEFPPLRFVPSIFFFSEECEILGINPLLFSFLLPYSLLPFLHLISILCPLSVCSVSVHTPVLLWCYGA